MPNFYIQKGGIDLYKNNFTLLIRRRYKPVPYDGILHLQPYEVYVYRITVPAESQTVSFFIKLLNEATVDTPTPPLEVIVKEVRSTEAVLSTTTYDLCALDELEYQSQSVNANAAYVDITLTNYSFITPISVMFRLPTGE